MTSILELEHSVWRAVMDNDGDRLAALFSDDYMEVTADGKRVSRDSIVENSPVVDAIESYQITHATTVELSPDIIILSYHLNLHGLLHGEPIEPPNRWVTSIWKLDEGTWMCCFFQQTASYSGSDNLPASQN